MRILPYKVALAIHRAPFCLSVYKKVYSTVRTVSVIDYAWYTTDSHTVVIDSKTFTVLYYTYCSFQSCSVQSGPFKDFILSNSIIRFTTMAAVAEEPEAEVSTISYPLEVHYCGGTL